MKIPVDCLARRVLILAMLLLFQCPLASADPVAVILFMGQSNMNALGTQTLTVLPGAPGFNAACSGYIIATAPAGASPHAGTLVCSGNVKGTIMAGQAVSYPASSGPRYVSASNVSGTMPSVTGTGGLGSYVVSSASTGGATGTPAAPVAFSLTMPDIGGSGALNPNCMIWTPNAANTAGSWQVNHPFVNTGPIAPAHMFGPESSFCQNWTAAHPGQKLYMIKASQGGSFLCNKPDSNDISPESISSRTRVYRFAQQETSLAEAALAAQFGGAGYRIVGIVYVQGEQDNQDRLCGFPLAPFNAVGNPAAASGPNVYLANLADLIGRFAIAQPIVARFTGSISGTVLTVSALSSGSINQYQSLSGPGILPATYIGTQIDGSVGGTGHYNLKVDQVSGQKVTILSSSGASTACGYVSGLYFLADARQHSRTAVTQSCVSGGEFHIGDNLSGANLAPTTFITALDNANHAGDGLYTINVRQSVNAETMTAAVAGWGNGAGTARFITNRTAGSQNNGVGLAQQTISDNPAVVALPAATVNTNDRWIYPPNPLHYDGQWYSEFGRRLYQAFIGQCTYHQPTC